MNDQTTGGDQATDDGDKAGGDEGNFFKAAGDTATGDKAAGDKTAGDKTGDDKAAGDKTGDDKAWTGPDFIHEKYRNTENPVEEQAKAYAEAMKKVNQKTEALREEVRAELEAKAREERGAPEGSNAYEYPEGWQPPENEALDQAFRDWAHKVGMSQEQFAEAVELYGQTMPNLEAEKARLGDNAGARLEALRAWGAQAIPPELHMTATKLVQTAEGVELLEHFMGVKTQSGVLPDEGVKNGRDVPTREGLRELMARDDYIDPAKRSDKVVREVEVYAKRLAEHLQKAV